MSTRFIVSAVVGVAVGYFSGSPQAGFQAFSLTYGVTGSLDPNKKVQGPRLDDTKLASAAYGAPMAYVEGHPRLAGNIVWCIDPKREVATETTQDGKGGPGVDTKTFTYEVDLRVVLSENPGVKPRRIWSNGALVWSAAAEADAETLLTQSNLTSWRDMRVYDGNPTQMPDPTEEAYVGLGNSPAYRDRSSIVFVGLNLGQSGQFPVLTIEVYTLGTVEEAGFVEDFSAGLGPYIPHGTPNPDVFSIVEGYSGAGLQVLGGLVTPISSSIIRTVATDPFTRFSALFKFDYLETTGNVDDAPAVNVFDAGGNVVGFSPAREKFYDSGQRAFVVFGAGAPQFVSDAALTVGLWYEIILQITSSSTCVVKLNLAGGALLKETTITGSFTEWTADRLGFADQSSIVDGTKPTVIYDNIVLGSPGQRITLEETPLDEVVQRQWVRAGLDASRIDVTALVGLFVRSMAVTQITSPRQILDMHAQARFFEFVESGDVVKCVLRGGAPVATIPFEDLGASAGDPVEPLPRKRGNELELPAQATVKFANVDDDYQDGAETSSRLATGSSIVTVAEIPIGMTPTEAKRLAENLVTDAFASIISVGPISLTRKWAKLEPTDVVLLTGRSGSLYRTRLLTRNDAGGVVTFTGVLDDATAVNSQALTSGGYNSSTLVRAVPATTPYLLDIPILRDVDNTPGFYVVFSAPGTWRGARLMRSVDDVTFEAVLDATARGSVGQATTMLGDWTGGNVTDERNSVTVSVGSGSALSSYTDDDLINGVAQPYLIGSEILYARDADLVSDGVWTLSGLLRSQRGTEWATGLHAAGEVFVVLAAAGMRRVQEQQADIGIPRYWRAMTFGAALSSATSKAFTDTGAGVTPYAPVDFQIMRDVASGDAAIDWHRRSRLSSRFLAEGIDPPLGELIEGYFVEIWDSTYATLKRTIPVAGAPSTVYTGAQQTTDFGSAQSTIYARVFQQSSAVGRGYPLQAAA